MAHFYLIVSLSAIISSTQISLTISSLELISSFSSSSSSSMAPLNAIEIFLQPLTICFLSSLSSMRASLYLRRRLFSLLILYISLLLISSNTFAFSLSFPAMALSFSFLFLMSISCLKWNMSSTLCITFLTISCRYWIWIFPFSINRGLGIVTFMRSIVSTLLVVLLWFFFVGLLWNWVKFCVS